MDAFLAPFAEVRPTDVVDILLVTALVYAVVLWLRGSRASLVAFGVLLLALVFSAARALGLQLTTWLFQGFFAVFLIIVVVIFQEELRQVFERVALLGLRRSVRAEAPREVTDLLVECLGNLARQRVGAILVLPGEQPLSRHVRGGIELDAKVSIPLLESLTDPHSPGHDGAILLSGERVSRFGVHLPLSTNFARLSGFGTRHAAALGLAERTDAICFVVSEERGSISVASKGEIRRLRDASEVAHLLRELGELRAAATPSLWRRVRWLDLVGAFAAVLILWFVLVPGARPSILRVEAPVVVTNVPVGYELEKIDPPEVEIALSGPSRAFYLLDKDAIDVTVDATLANLGRRTFAITSEQVRKPAAMTVEDIAPAQVRISLASKQNRPGA